MRASITCLSNRIKELEGKVDQPTIFDLNKDKLESLDSKFKVHHYAVVDIVDKDEEITKEQEVLDEHNYTIAELAIRIKKLISTSVPLDPNPCKIKSRKLTYLEKSLSTVCEEIKTLSERSDDTCLIHQYEEQLWKTFVTL